MANSLVNFLLVCFYRFYTADVTLYVQLCIHFLKQFPVSFVTQLSADLSTSSFLESQLRWHFFQKDFSDHSHLR